MGGGFYPPRRATTLRPCGPAHEIGTALDRGREGRLDSTPPPSEPDERVSRIRLSSWWVTRYDGIDRASHGLPSVRTTPAAESRHWASDDDPALVPLFTPVSRAANIRSVHTAASTHPHRTWVSPARFSPFRHCCRFFLPRSVRHVSTFLRPFAPRPLRRFLAPMDALTPVRPALRLSQHEHRLTARTGLPDSRTLPSDHSISTHLKCLRHRFGTLSQRRGSPCLCAGSRLHLWLAGSSPTPGRIEFVILRTGRSPPVALHLASRQRSYSWFQVVSVDLERTFTSLTSCAFRRTSPGLFWARGFSAYWVKSPRREDAPGLPNRPGAFRRIRANTLGENNSSEH
jgi:hypothetical protein